MNKPSPGPDASAAAVVAAPHRCYPLPELNDHGASMRVLVCDDEAPARDRLAAMLSRVRGVTLATASSGEDALSQLERFKPSLMLLDIEMPEKNGFDIVEMVAAMMLPNPPLLVFVTAHSNFAPDAFTCGAIDFLLKPVRQERLEIAIARARENTAAREAGARLAEVEEQVRRRQGANAVDRDHVWVVRRGERIRINLDDIDRISGEDAYSRLHIGEVSYLYGDSLTHLADRLDPERYVRVHRSHIVRIDRVSSIRRTLYGGSEVVLSTAEVIPIGRKYAQTARPRLMGTKCQAVGH